MKQIIKKCVKSLIIFFSYIFSPRFSRKLLFKYNQLYTLWLSREFKCVGNGLFLVSPLYIHGGKYISIGENFNSGLRLRLEAFDEHLGHKFTPKIIIGNNVSINSDCHIGAINEIIIENGVLIASKVFITDHFHGEITSEAISTPPSQRKLFSKGPVKIEKNVWIGEGVVILPGVIIGENSIIGSNSVITRNIPKNSVVAGNPAKIIRTL